MNVKALTGTLVRDLVGTETTPMGDDAHLRAVVDWLYRAHDATATGGCAATYNLVLGWEAAYPETTGYIVPTLYDFAAYADEPEARTRAERMARWLLEIQLDGGAFPAGTVGEPSEPSVFNTGQILFGLARAYEETSDKAFAAALRAAGRWLSDHQEPEGYWTAYTYEDTVHAYTSRVGWALALAHEVSGEAQFRRAAERNLEWVRECQRPNDSFKHWAFTPDSDAFLHTIAYTIRGLIEGGSLLGHRPAVSAGQRAADRLVAVQRSEGALAGAYTDEWESQSFDCLTGTAQMAVVWLRLAELTGESVYIDAAHWAIEHLKRLHRLDGPEPIRGGIAGSRPVWGPYMRLRYPNWAPKFFADAVLAANDVKTTPTEKMQL